MFYGCYNVNSKLLALANCCGIGVINGLRICCYRQMIKDEIAEVREAFFSRCWHSMVLVSKYFKCLTIFFIFIFYDDLQTSKSSESVLDLISKLMTKSRKYFG